MENEGILYKTKDFHFRCLYHILNLGVQAILKCISGKYSGTILNRSEETDDFEDGDYEEEQADVFAGNALMDIFMKIRSTRKKIKNSGQLRIMLKGFCEMKKIKYIVPTADVPTRWNSTWLILNNASRLEVAITLM